MIFTEQDIDFSSITPVEFENLLYELLPYYGFSSISWRQGGADSGRDIEAKLLFQSSLISDHYTKWFFECKHYKNGVPPEELNSKIAWADAERPDFLCIVTTAYLTNGARVWLDALRPQKAYKIFVIEGVELKRKLVATQSVIPKYFSSDKYIKLFNEIKRHNLLYNITPSYEAMEQIINNIAHEKFELNDLGFLLRGFYQNYERMEAEDDFTGMFDKTLPYKLLPRLKEVSNQVDISTYLTEFDYVGGSGFIDKSEVEQENDLPFQDYVLHLNHKQEREKWDMGIYILVVADKKQAFELFFSDKAKFETNAFFHNEYDEKVLDRILEKWCSEEMIEQVKKCSKGVL